MVNENVGSEISQMPELQPLMHRVTDGLPLCTNSAYARMVAKGRPELESPAATVILLANLVVLVRIAVLCAVHPEIGAACQQANGTLLAFGLQASYWVQMITVFSFLVLLALYSRRRTRQAWQGLRVY